MGRSVLILLLLLWGFEKVEAAAPARYPVMHNTWQQALASQPAAFVPTKPSLLQKLQWKLLQKRLKKVAAHGAATRGGPGSVLSTIAFVLGLLGILVLFISSLSGFSILLGLGALVTGIIAVAGKNRSWGTNIKSIIAIVLGGLLLVGWILLIAALGSLFSSIE